MSDDIGTSPTRSPGRIAVGLLVAAVIVATGLQLLDANPAVSQSSTVTALRVDHGPRLDPKSDLWDRAHPVSLQLSAQQVTYPFGGGSIPTVQVRALHDRSTLYLQLDWADSSKDDSTATTETFSDAVAVEFPASAGSSVPSVCMGQADAGVNIWQWRADSQRGLPATPLPAHPNAYVDEYQSKQDLAYPARKTGNPYAKLHAGPVQDLVALGFGTLGPATTSLVTGRGIYRGNYDSGHWTVVLARPFQSSAEAQPSFGVGTQTDLAFAVWNGHEGDRNGKKSVSQFAKLRISKATAAPGPWGGWTVIVFVLFGVMLVVGVLVSRRLRRRPA